MTETQRETDLAIEGMTCASCVARVEKNLQKIDGVTALVNLATEKAHVAYPPTVTQDELIKAVQRAGYTAKVVPAPHSDQATESHHRNSADKPPSAAFGSGEAMPAGHQHASMTAAPHAGKFLDADTTTLRNRLTISIALTIPVLVLSMVPAWQFDYWQWLVFALASPVIIWGAYPFHRAAFVNLRHGATTMDTLVSMGVIAAYIWSVVALFFGHAGMPGMTHGFDWFTAPEDALGQIYLEAAAGVTTFILLGRYLEDRSKRSAGAALRALLELGAKSVTVKDADGTERVIPIEELRVDDEFLVRPGENIATDGVVLTGTSAINESMMTGESVPREVQPGSEVIGATVNTNGFLSIRASKVGSDTQLARIAKIVEAAQVGKSRTQRLADRISSIFVPLVILIAVITFAVWMLVSGSLTLSFSAAVAVLIIACPCALGLAIPTAILVGTGRGAQLGILIRGPEALETSGRVDTIVFDKTGTLTEGNMKVTDFGSLGELPAEEALRLVGSLEHASEHPIGEAVASAARDRELSLSTVTNVENLPGFGIRGRVDDLEITVSNLAALAARGGLDAETEAVQALQVRAGRGAETIVVASWNGAPQAWFAVRDVLRSDAALAVEKLHALGLKTVLLSGDDSRVAQAVGAEVGVAEVIGEVLPEQKVAKIQELQAAGQKVAMVGDGVNDAAAIATADLGIAIGTGTSAAIEASDITLLRSDLMVAVDAVRLSRKTLGTMYSNLFWAFIYNVLMIPLAAFGLLNPLFAGAAMAFSSVFVVLNSLRLRGFRATKI